MRTSRSRSLLLAAIAGLATVVTACGASSADKSTAGPASVQPAIGAAPSAAGRASSSVGGSVAGGTPIAGSTSGAPAAGAGGAQTQTIGASVAPAAADIVENGSLAVRFRTAAGLRSSYAAIAGLATGAGGFVSSSTETDGRRPTASVTLRVPDDAVQSVLRRIGAMGQVTRRTLSGDDVTGRVVDLSVEITNLTSEEAAVRQLLTKSGSIANILTVQQQLFQLQDEVQELTAQSNSLDNRVEYATVAVALSTVGPPPAPVRHTRLRHRSTLARFWHLASSHSTGLVRDVILAVGWAAPGLVVLAVAGLAGFVVRRRRHRPAVAGVGGATPDSRSD